MNETVKPAMRPAMACPTVGNLWVGCSMLNFEFQMKDGLYL